VGPNVLGPNSSGPNVLGPNSSGAKCHGAKCRGASLLGQIVVLPVDSSGTIFQELRVQFGIVQDRIQNRS
jgi:hypothetical protein